MIEIYHRRKLSFTAFAGLLNPAGIDMADYVHVATVGADLLEEAFALTQHLNESAWLDRQPVIRRTTGQVRSTSAGDVFIKDGRRFLVGLIGFTELAER